MFFFLHCLDCLFIVQVGVPVNGNVIEMFRWDNAHASCVNKPFSYIIWKGLDLAVTF